MRIETEHYDWWNRPDPQEPIEEEQELLTEQTHVPTRDMIRQFKLAGMRLEEARKHVYDFTDDSEVDTEIPIPTRRTDFDPAEASMIMDDFKKKIRVPDKPQIAPEAPEDSAEALSTGVNSVKSQSRQEEPSTGSEEK